MYNLPAFPMPYSTDEHDQPCNVTTANEGMTLRDYFAGQALIGLISNKDWLLSDAKLAYEVADEMLKTR